jgi:hypothetical protein
MHRPGRVRLSDPLAVKNNVDLLAARLAPADRDGLEKKRLFPPWIQRATARWAALAFSFGRNLPRPMLKPLDLVCPVDRATENLDRRSYLHG